MDRKAETLFYGDKVMSYPQLIVWALEMRRMMGVGVPVGIIRHLEETWDAQQTLGVYEEGRRLQRPGRSSFRRSCNQRVG